MSKKRSDNLECTNAEVRRSPHTIRFLEPEWQRVEAFAEARGLAPAEFVRFATLAMIADGGASVSRLAPLIERTFRGTYMLASRMRTEMLAARSEEELDAMIAAARKLQDELLGVTST